MDCHSDRAHLGLVTVTGVSDSRGKRRIVRECYRIRQVMRFLDSDHRLT
jgi:hypothetical protein